jgi:hypothetical protein
MTGRASISGGRMGNRPVLVPSQRLTKKDGALRGFLRAPVSGCALGDCPAWSVLTRGRGIGSLGWGGGASDLPNRARPKPPGFARAELIPVLNLIKRQNGRNPRPYWVCGSF